MRSYYKVLSESGKLYSAIMGRSRGFEYPVGEWLKRPHTESGFDHNYGPFAVFEQLHQAKWFAAQYTRYPIIYACMIKRSRARSMWAPRQGRVGIQGAPRGTVLADAVMITERVRTE